MLVYIELSSVAIIQYLINQKQKHPYLTLQTMFQQVPVLKFQDENQLQANHMEMLDDLSDGLTPIETPQFDDNFSVR